MIFAFDIDLAGFLSLWRTIVKCGISRLDCIISSLQISEADLSRNRCTWSDGHSGNFPSTRSDIQVDILPDQNPRSSDSKFKRPVSESAFLSSSCKKKSRSRGRGTHRSFQQPIHGILHIRRKLVYDIVFLLQLLLHPPRRVLPTRGIPRTVDSLDQVPSEVQDPLAGLV